MRRSEKNARKKTKSRLETSLFQSHLGPIQQAAEENVLRLLYTVVVFVRQSIDTRKWFDAIDSICNQYLRILIS